VHVGGSISKLYLIEPSRLVSNVNSP